MGIMKYAMRIISGAILLLFLMMSCERDSVAPPIDQTPSDPTITKSSKRGISYNLTDALDLDTLKSGVSWWYNWYFETSAPEGYYADFEMEFIPMLWGSSPSAQDLVRAKSFILEHEEIDYLLVMNEPNLVDQANRTPGQVVADWVIYEQFIADLANEGRDIKIVGPAMNWGTMENYGDPVVWLDAFYEAFLISFGREPKSITSHFTGTIMVWLVNWIVFRSMENRSG